MADCEQAAQELKTIIEKQQIDSNVQNTEKALRNVQDASWTKELITKTKIPFWVGRIMKTSKSDLLKDLSTEVKSILLAIQTGGTVRPPTQTQATQDNEKRNRYRNAFRGELEAETPGTQDAARIALEIEEAIYRNCPSTYDKQYILLINNMRDAAKNKKMRITARLLTGELTPEQFSRMTANDFLTEEQISQNDELDKIAMRNSSVPKPPPVVSTHFRCPKCHSNLCTFYQQQVRSADEPMTNFITCQECGYNWRT